MDRRRGESVMLCRLGVGSVMVTGAGLSGRKECCESGERHTGEAVGD